MNKNKHIGKNLIKNLEDKRKSKIIAYFTGDRRPFGSQIGFDAVRPLYEHLLNLEFNSKNKKIDLFLYSLGGHVSVPWRIVSMIREFCTEFNLLIPYKAYSAATLISLGADNIIMGKKAELGPIDPTLKKGIGETPVAQQEIAVEDVNSFISFIKERANINDQDALAQILNGLIKQVGPLNLGLVHRQHHHIRLVSRKLLIARNEKIDEEKLESIIETLTQKIYSHGHAIGRKEAKDIGLPIKYPNNEEEDLIWKLYLKYEDFLKLQEPIYPELLFEDKDTHTIQEMPVALVESVNKVHLFNSRIDLRQKREIPQNPQININIGINLPPEIQPEQITKQAQEIINQMLKQISQQISGIVQKEIARQSPTVGFDYRQYGEWREI